MLSDLSYQGLGRIADAIRAHHHVAWMAMLFVTSCVHVPHSNSNTSAMTDQQPSEPIRFGLLTDVQYADKETAGKRRYREALVNLEQCVLDLKTRDLDFVVHCGNEPRSHSRARYFFGTQRSSSSCDWQPLPGSAAYTVVGAPGVEAQLLFVRVGWVAFHYCRCSRLQRLRITC